MTHAYFWVGGRATVDGVQMNSAIDQNLIRYIGGLLARYPVPAKLTSTLGMFFIAKVHLKPGQIERDRGTEHPPMLCLPVGLGGRSLILHGSNDPLLSGVACGEHGRNAADIEGVKDGRGRGRLSHVYLMIIFMSVSHTGGRALLLPVCMVYASPQFFSECTMR